MLEKFCHHGKLKRSKNNKGTYLYLVFSNELIGLIVNLA